MDTMRDIFFNALFIEAQKDKDIVVISADCGAPSLDQWRLKIPNQFVNVGIAEQNMIGVAIGLALEGKKVFCYAITPFASLRCLEQIKIGMGCMKLPITILACGAGFSYEFSGPTHHATEDISCIRAIPNTTVYNPCDSYQIKWLVKETLKQENPVYIRLDRKKMPNDIYSVSADFNYGVAIVKRSKDSKTVVISTGNLVHEAMNQNDFTVIDLFRLKPVNAEWIITLVKEAKEIITYEEHVLNGGLGSIISEVVIDSGIKIPVKRIGINDKYLFDYGGRKILQEKAGLAL